MSEITEITSLFTRLASHLQSQLSPPIDEDPLLFSISSLNQTLNLNKTSRVRVLDTALSLMCFKAPQVFDSAVECMLETIITVLSSSISCKVERVEREEYLQIGSSISRGNCSEVMGACLDVFDKVERHETLPYLLLRALLKVVVSASCFQSLFPLKPLLNVQSSYIGKTAVSKLHGFLPEEISVNYREMPLRLYLWYLDPLVLKHDISKILLESAQRPFLNLKKELHDRTTWRSVITCLVLSPTMFIETRSLLHNWFLMTGLVSILELQIILVSLVLDVLSYPMRWGISSEVGTALPFSHAYFPINQRLLAILMGPLSCGNFTDLVNFICSPISCAEKPSYSIFNQNSKKGRIDHKSTWSMLMAFPSWFFFAAVLLFSKENFENIFISTSTTFTAKTEETHDVHRYSDAAARYLACIMSPTSVTQRDLLFAYFVKISRSWTLKQCGPDRKYDKAGFKKKLVKSKLRDMSNTASDVYDSQTISTWLKEFHGRLMLYLSRTYKHCELSGVKASTDFCEKQILLFQRIPLGILIGCSNIDEGGCEVLLHYATTGLLISLTETKNAKSKLVKMHEASNKWEEAVIGACLVFSLFDVIEDMSDSIFETEESGVDFIFKLKKKSLRFLINYVMKLLNLTTDEVDRGRATLVDLYQRLEQWRHKEREVFQGYKALEDLVSALKRKISCL
ncbi:hypothetical protein GIB67_026376 [Kingdonia uniflora]|uniref:Uncharacterized protein n=1 Tax=Kingdonia uniflora TaxID=39325 RepID=A0A7J7P6T0_9MAGN|nr:hypothetical protein GIB67_026376 [Kingdonia uniflora]